MGDRRRNEESQATSTKKARPQTVCGSLPQVPKLDARERATLAAIRAGAKSVGGVLDRLSGSHGSAAVRRCVTALAGYGLITGDAEGPWELTEAAKSVDHKPPRRGDSDRGRAAIVTAAIPPSSRPGAVRCPHGRTVHCPWCMSLSVGASDPAPTVMGGLGVGQGVGGRGSYDEAERRIKTPIAIVQRTSDTLLL